MFFTYCYDHVTDSIERFPVDFTTSDHTDVKRVQMPREIQNLCRDLESNDWQSFREAKQLLYGLLFASYE